MIHGNFMELFTKVVLMKNFQDVVARKLRNLRVTIPGDFSIYRYGYLEIA